MSVSRVNGSPVPASADPTAPDQKANEAAFLEAIASVRVVNSSTAPKKPSGRGADEKNDGPAAVLPTT